MTSAKPPGPPARPTPPPPPPPPPPGGAPPVGGTPLAGSTTEPGLVDGTTEVLPSVIQKIVALAAREIPGVVELGAGGASRAVGAVRQTLTGGSENTAGVRVDLADQQARIAMDVAIEYGVGARELVKSLRRHIPRAVEEIAGVPVVQLDIVITDVRIPGAEAEPGQ